MADNNYVVPRNRVSRKAASRYHSNPVAERLRAHRLHKGLSYQTICDQVKAITGIEFCDRTIRRAAQGKPLEEITVHALTRYLEAVNATAA
jgi:hypothetical protein